MKEALKTMWKHRRRVAGLIALVGALVVGSIVSTGVEREVNFELEANASWDELEIAYVDAEGDLIRGARVAPAAIIREQTSLVPGRYRLRAQYRASGSLHEIERPFEVPADGTIRMNLEGP